LSKAVLDNPAKSSYDLIVILIVNLFGGANFMVRRQQRLSALQVAKLSKPGLYGDGGGLTLQITTTGAKSWLLRYMMAGKPFGMGLGPTHTVSLAEARQKALDARKLLIEGINPLVVKRQNRIAGALASAKMMTFDQCAEAYILAHKAGWKNAKHADQWTNTLNTYASPVFGHLPVAEIDTGLVVKCLSPIWESKTETASRLRGRIESVLGWATTSGYRTGENPARWKGHLDNLLATISKSSRTKHHPSLPWQRIGAFMSALRAREGVSARAVEFAILTACRSGEVRGAKWTEFDTAGKVWTIPAERMKAKREHEVPLSDAALALLESMPKVGEIVFAGTKKQLLSDMSLTAVIRRMNGDDKPVWADANGEGVTVHGFRSSFRMWAAETTNYPREVAEHALAHQLPDAVERAYQRGSQFAKRAALMAEWSAYCATVQTDAVVKPIRGATRADGGLFCDGVLHCANYPRKP
jgi:integrase